MKIISVKEAARHFNITIQAVYYQIKVGNLKMKKVLDKKGVVIDNHFNKFSPRKK